MARSSARQSLGVLTLLALSACAPAAPAAPVGLSDADRAAIEQSTAEFTQYAKAANYDGVTKLYTADAVVMPPNASTATGQAAITEFMRSFPPITEMTFKVVSLDGVGDLAYVHGTYSMTMMMPDSTTSIDSGKYLEIRRKQADGSWLITHDIFNSNFPLPGAEAAPKP